MNEKIDRSQRLERESVRSRSAALATVVAGILVPAGTVIVQMAMQQSPVANRPSELRYLADHVAGYLGGMVVQGLGLALIAVAATYLYNSIKLRKPDLATAVLVLGIAGPVVIGAVTVAQSVYLAIESSSYSALDTQTIERAKEIYMGPVRIALGSFGLAATLALGFWLVLGPLFAMRVGLLTRPMGVIGIVIGAAMVLYPPVSLLLIGFWLIALGALFAGFWPTGRPPAWEMGEAVPWPSLKGGISGGGSGPKEKSQQLEEGAS